MHFHENTGLSNIDFAHCPLYSFVISIWTICALQCTGKLFWCFPWNPGHENWEKSWNPGQNFSLMLSVSWIPRQCLSWIPRQYCCYNDTFPAALWLVRFFWVIIIGNVELELNHFYINGNCFDWHEKSQSTKRDTHDLYQNWSMSLKNGRLWRSGSLFKTALNFEKYDNLCDIGVFVWIILS